MRVEEVRTLEGISNYVSDYIVKGLKGREGIGFRYFEKRFAISQTCVRPSRVVIPLFPTLSGKELQQRLSDSKLGWVYDLLRDTADTDYALEYIGGRVVRTEVGHDD